MKADPTAEGLLPVNKPEGISSFGVIGRVRKATGIKRVGHAGTLDPFASGLLMVAIGRSFTRKISDIQGLDKTYKLTIGLGLETDTLDPYGTIVETQLPARPFDQAKFKTILSSFIGTYMQTPPAFSAKKIDGKRAYALARKGTPVIPDPVPVHIHDIRFLGYRHFNLTFADIEVDCGKGTYVRSLARDIGTAYGCPAYVQQLTRTKIGPYTLDQAIDGNDVTAESVSRGRLRAMELYHDR